MAWQCYDGAYAPFTPDEDCRATGRDSGNRHLLLVVAPSPLVVTIVRRYRHPVVDNSCGTVEKQSCTCRMTNMQKTFTAV